MNNVFDKIVKYSHILINVNYLLYASERYHLRT